MVKPGSMESLTRVFQRHNIGSSKNREEGVESVRKRGKKKKREEEGDSFELSGKGGENSGREGEKAEEKKKGKDREGKREKKHVDLLA